MNSYLQIACGVIPAIIAMVVAIICTKKLRVSKIVVALFLTGVAVFGAVTHVAAEKRTIEQSKKESQKSLNIVYALMNEGDYTEAKKMLNQLEESTVYLNDYALCGARLAAVEGNYIMSRELFEKSGADLSSGDIAKEYSTVCDCLVDSAVDYVAYENDPEYSSTLQNIDTVIMAAELARNSVKDVIKNSVGKYLDNESGTFRDTAAFIVKANEIYSEYIENGVFDEEQVDDLLDDSEDLVKEDSSVNSESLFRIARLKLMILKEDFKKLAESIDEESDYHELLVITELYVNGYIKEKDFSDSYGKTDQRVYTKIYDHLSDLYEDVFEDEDKDTINEVKDCLKSLKYKINHPALAELENTLLSYAENSNTPDRTKIYMQMAQYSYHEGDKTETNTYLSSALNTITNCTDPVYMDAMCEIIGIINEKDNPESLKDIVAHVDNIVNNSTTIELAEKLNKAKEEEKEEESENDENVDIGFDTYLSDYVSKKRTSLNILNIDTSDFSKISFTVGVDSDLAYSAEQLKEALTITDCGVNIENFSVKEISYSAVNIVLVCDTSGSMSGSPIEDLKNAVSMFIDNKTSKENIGIITFESDVTGTYGLDTSIEELKAVVDSIRSNGGTNIYDAVVASTALLEGRADELNVIILMSDGQDGYNPTESQIYENVIEPCIRNATLLYSLGLGSYVDAEYLESFATPTGGDYLYVQDSATLSSFYEYLHSMVVNRYSIEFIAKDTLRNNRNLKVQIKDDDLAYDTIKYSLDGEDQEESENNESTVVYQDRYVSGFDTRFVFKTNTEQKIGLIGKGFTSDDSISVKLKGKLSYDLKVNFVSKEKFEVIIPANVIDGTYDVEVELNGGVGYFTNEFIVGDELYTTKFGGYTFMSTGKSVNGNTTKLFGYVCLNDWLCFKGDVTLIGDLEKDYFITMYDADGSYVKFDKEKASGLAKNLVENNKTVHIEALGQVKIYDDTSVSATSTKYKVDPVVIPEFYASDIVTLSTPGLSLYPYSIKLDYKEFSLNMPYQKELLKSAKELFNFSCEENVFMLSSTSVGIKIELKYQNDSPNYSQICFGNMPLYMTADKCSITIDTYSNTYGIDFNVKFAFMDVEGVGLSMKWNDKFQIQSIYFKCDKKITHVYSGVPVTFSKFEVGVNNIDYNKPFYMWQLEGKTTISVAQMSEVLPKIDKYLGDASIISFENTTITLVIGDGYFKISTTCKVIDKIPVGKAVIEAGKFSYSNTMLGLKSESVLGMRAECSVNANVGEDNFKLNFGGTGELAITSKYTGLMLKGSFEATVKWWLFKECVNMYADALIGVYESNGQPVFTLRARSAGYNTKNGILLEWKGGSPILDTKYY